MHLLTMLLTLSRLEETLINLYLSGSNRAIDALDDPVIGLKMDSETAFSSDCHKYFLFKKAWKFCVSLLCFGNNLNGPTWMICSQ